ncbi:MAG TPA: hypothetical protein VKV20_06505 [Ktedonobacteraceae bacterium]|jgi:hypothetical protein|nr:hypothetical protein [Ktedonobacteraceae bacterium]
MIATTGAYIRLVPSSGTFRSATSRTLIGSSIAVPAPVIVAETEAILEGDASIQTYHALIPKRPMEEEEVEEREWDSIVSKPHVRDALRRMAVEAQQQYSAGETKEGGFGLE